MHNTIGLLLLVQVDLVPLLSHMTFQQLPEGELGAVATKRQQPKAKEKKSARPQELQSQPGMTHLSKLLLVPLPLEPPLQLLSGRSRGLRVRLRERESSLWSIAFKVRVYKLEALLDPCRLFKQRAVEIPPPPLATAPSPHLTLMHPPRKTEGRLLQEGQSAQSELEEGVVEVLVGGQLLLSSWRLRGSWTSSVLTRRRMPPFLPLGGKAGPCLRPTYWH